jgi:hypothetical protein
MAHRSRLALAAAAALLLAGCASHGHGPGMGGGMGMGHQHDGMARHDGSHDMAQMCGMHRETTAGKSPAEQQAAIESHIRSMHGTVTPEMVEQHRRMMDTRCPAVAAPAR